MEEAEEHNMAKKKSPLYRRQIHVRRTRKLQQKNQNLTGKAVGAIGHAVGKAVDDYKKPKKGKDEGSGEAKGGFEITQKSGLTLDPPKTYPPIDEVPVLLGGKKQKQPTNPAAPVEAKEETAQPIVMPNTGIGGTEWTPGQEHTYPEGPRMEDDAWLHPGAPAKLAQTGGIPQQGPLIAPTATASHTLTQGTSYYGQQEQPKEESFWGSVSNWWNANSPFDRNPGMVKEYYKNNHRRNPYGNSPLKRTDDFTPAAEGIEGGTQYVDQIQRAAAPSYLGDIGAAAAEGYNVAVDRHNYKQRVWAEKQRDLEDAYGKLQVEPTGQTAWDVHAQNMGKEWVNEFTELYNNRDSYDPAEYSAKLADIKGRAAQYQKASNNLQQIVASYDENLDNVSASTPPETIDILETLRKNTGTLSPVNVDGVPTLQGVTIGGQEVSVPLSEIANGKNLWRFNTKVPIQPKLDALTKDLGQFRTEIAKNGGITEQSIGWENLQERAAAGIDHILQNPSEAQAIAAERYGIDHDDWMDMENSGMDPMAELKKRMLADVGKQFQPYQQIVSGTKVDPVAREQRIAANQARQQAGGGSAVDARAKQSSEAIINKINNVQFTPEGLSELKGYGNIKDVVIDEGTTYVQIGRDYIEISSDEATARKQIAQLAGADPRFFQQKEESPVNRSPFKRLMDFFTRK